MPQIVNIPADTEPVAVPTVADYQAEFDAAEAEFNKLIKERRTQRGKLSKAAFRKYNDDTTDKQVAAAAAVESTRKALSRALRRSPGQTVTVGTATSAEDVPNG